MCACTMGICCRRSIKKKCSCCFKSDIAAKENSDAEKDFYLHKMEKLEDWNPDIGSNDQKLASMPD